ncbi:hypothetical protein BOX15_Mlig019500g2 [Macrostomum lignano]|uniref:BTB domain-containing protein n=1 Tax=Macrostomum lignano TaxID=282301 RepID=A0A267ERP5_9PLAT|nr:hypothetical protein BOX15_Mlig019500g2 [Macrostomum lignano]
MAGQLDSLLSSYSLLKSSGGPGASLVAKRRIHDLLRSAAPLVAMEASEQLVAMANADAEDTDDVEVYLSVRCLRLVTRLPGGPQRLAAAGACPHLLNKLAARLSRSPGQQPQSQPPKRQQQSAAQASKPAKSSASVITTAIIRLLGHLLPACSPEHLTADDLDCSPLVTVASAGLLGGDDSRLAFNCLAALCRCSAPGRQACLRAGFPACLARLLLLQLQADQPASQQRRGRRRLVRRSLAAYYRLCADPWSRVRLPAESDCHRVLIVALRCRFSWQAVRLTAMRCIACFAYDRRGLAELARWGLASALVDTLTDEAAASTSAASSQAEAESLSSASNLASSKTAAEKSATKSAAAPKATTAISTCASPIYPTPPYSPTASSASSGSSSAASSGDSSSAASSASSDCDDDFADYPEDFHGVVRDDNNDDDFYDDDAASLFSEVVPEEEALGVDEADEAAEPDGEPVTLGDVEGAALHCLTQLASDSRLRPALLEPAATLRLLVDYLIARPHLRCWLLMRQLAGCQFALEPLISGGCVLALARRFDPDCRAAGATSGSLRAETASARCSGSCYELDQVLDRAAITAGSHFGLETLRSLSRFASSGRRPGLARLCALSLPCLLLRPGRPSDHRTDSTVTIATVESSTICRAHRATGFVARLFRLLRRSDEPEDAAADNAESPDAELAGLGLRRLLHLCLSRLGPPGQRLSDVVSSSLRLSSSTSCSAADIAWTLLLQRGSLQRQIQQDKLSSPTCQFGARIASEPADLLLTFPSSLDGDADSPLPSGLSCHRAALTARSDYFRALLAGSFAESGSTRIQLHDVDPPTVESVLHLAYGCADSGSACLHLQSGPFRRLADYLRLVACRRRFLLDLPSAAEAVLMRASFVYFSASPASSSSTVESPLSRLLTAASVFRDSELARLCLARLLASGRLGVELADVLTPDSRLAGMCEDRGRWLHDFLYSFCDAALAAL